jgi:hypothetical protein
LIDPARHFVDVRSACREFRSRLQGRGAYDPAVSHCGDDILRERQVSSAAARVSRCLRCQCLDRRIDSKQRLVSEIAAWERQRNTSRASIKWMFTTEKARAKMGRAYPKLSTKEAQSLS